MTSPAKFRTWGLSPAVGVSLTLLGVFLLTVSMKVPSQLLSLLAMVSFFILADTQLTKSACSDLSDIFGENVSDGNQRWVNNGRNFSCLLQNVYQLDTVLEEDVRYPMSVAAGQQLSSQTSLANYLVKGNIDLPEGGTAAPPQGIVMQFPGAQVTVVLIGRYEYFPRDV